MTVSGIFWILGQQGAELKYYWIGNNIFNFSLSLSYSWPWKWIVWPKNYCSQSFFYSLGHLSGFLNPPVPCPPWGLQHPRNKVGQDQFFGTRLRNKTYENSLRDRDREKVDADIFNETRPRRGCLIFRQHAASICMMHDAWCMTHDAWRDLYCRSESSNLGLVV